MAWADSEVVGSSQICPGGIVKFLPNRIFRARVGGGRDDNNAEMSARLSMRVCVVGLGGDGDTVQSIHDFGQRCRVFRMLLPGSVHDLGLGEVFGVPVVATPMSPMETWSAAMILGSICKHEGVPALDCGCRDAGGEFGGYGSVDGRGR